MTDEIAQCLDEAAASWIPRYEDGSAWLFIRVYPDGTLVIMNSKCARHFQHCAFPMAGSQARTPEAATEWLTEGGLVEVLFPLSTGDVSHIKNPPNYWSTYARPGRIMLYWDDLNSGDPQRVKAAHFLAAMTD